MKEKLLRQAISWEGFASSLMKMIVKKKNALLKMVRLIVSEEDYDIRTGNRRQHITI